MITLEVTCPEGVVEGDLLAVERPSDGASFEVPLPAGVESGGAFLVADGRRVLADLEPGLVEKLSARNISVRARSA